MKSFFDPNIFQGGNLVAKKTDYSYVCTFLHSSGETLDVRYRLSTSVERRLTASVRFGAPKDDEWTVVEEVYEDDCENSFCGVRQFWSILRAVYVDAREDDISRARRQAAEFLEQL